MKTVLNISFIFRICNLVCNTSAKKAECLPADSSRIWQSRRKKITRKVSAMGNIAEYCRCAQKSQKAESSSVM